MSTNKKPPHRGLTVPTNISLSRTEVNALLERFATLSEVEKVLAERGFPTQSDRPVYSIPVITAEVLNDIDSRAYNEVYAQQLGWYNYITPLYADAKAALLQAQNQLDLVEASVTKRIMEVNKTKTKTEKLTAAEVKVEVAVDPIYQDALLEVQHRKQHELKLGAFVDIVERNMRVVSRVIEMKKIEFDSNNRESNMGKVNERRQFAHKPLRRDR